MSNHSTVVAVKMTLMMQRMLAFMLFNRNDAAVLACMLSGAVDGLERLLPQAIVLCRPMFFSRTT
jgi:hypothetical protein